MPILIALLLLVLAISGVSSGMQSYATARQAEATIEVAQAAQISAYGNLITILMVALVLMSFLALAVWLVTRRAALLAGKSARHERFEVPQSAPSVLPQTPVAGLETLIQLEMLRTLREMNGSRAPQIGSQGDVLEPADGEGLHWLRPL